MTRILTLGHSDRSLGDVLQLLRTHGVGVLVDVRRFPGSRKHPQWNQSEITDALPADIGYTWISELGGRRRTPAGIPSLNGAWRVKAFQDYADHMTGEIHLSAITTAQPSKDAGPRPCGSSPDPRSW